MSNRIIDDITDFMFVNDEPQKSDVIFLPGDTTPNACEYASQLYHRGFAPFLIPSGGVSVKCDKWPGVTFKKDIYNGDYQTDCDFYTDVLLKNGVSKEAILPENKAGYTRANAFLSRKVADEHHLIVRKALLVCKAFHARRCLMLYQMAFPEAEIKVCTVHAYNITRNNWYKSEKGLHFVMGELARCGYQFVDDMENYLL